MKRYVWWRDQGGVDRAYVDLRPWRGGVRAVCAPGSRRALTKEQDKLAEELAAKMVGEWSDRRAEAESAAGHGVPLETGLADAVREHLLAKAKAGKVTDARLVAEEHYLGRAITHFGKAARLSTIGTSGVRLWVESLRVLKGRGGRRLDDGTIRHHLNALSNLFRRARAEEWVPKGHDPVGDLMEKPVADPEPARWLEVPEAALYLEAARCVRSAPAANGQPPVPFAEELVATFLLTGGRESEVLGLEVDDVSFDRNTITFRPNAWRRLKTEKSHRSVPLWPQLEKILRAYVFERPPSRLLFPSYRTGEESMLVDVRKLLDRVTERAGTIYLLDRDGRRRKAEPTEIRTKAFRHTYITARLQTLDGGRPVSPWTVAREVGHSGTDMIERTYGHLGENRHRARAVEYRVKQHRKVLGERLAAID